MSLDFAPVLKHIPFMRYLWRHFAEQVNKLIHVLKNLFALATLLFVFLLNHVFNYQVLNEDLRLVVGQQERMNNGANVWNWPVSYDKLGVRYRLWRDAVEKGAKNLPYSKSL